MWDDDQYDAPINPSQMLSPPKSPTSTAGSAAIVQPPPSVQRALELLRTQKERTGDNFNEFLKLAQQAVDTSRSINVPIEASYKLISGLPPEKNLDEDKNDTLCLIFDFYAKIRQHNSSKTFSDTLLSFQTWNFSKLEVFCRDFEIIPKLLTREEVRILWDDIGRDHVAKGLGIFTVIDFTEFKDLIVRMALWAYYKPGLKKLILTIDGFVPKPVDIVNCFTTYLKLYDDDYIHNFLRTVGRKTQGDYNYRSKDEMNLRTKVEVRVDTNARSLKQISRKGPSKSNLNSDGSFKVDAQGNEIKEKVYLSGANPREVITGSRPIFDSIQKLYNHPSRVQVQFSDAMNDRFEAIRKNPMKITAKDALPASEESEERHFETAVNDHRSQVMQQMNQQLENSSSTSKKQAVVRIKDGKLHYTFRPEVDIKDDLEYDEEYEDGSRRGSLADASLAPGPHRYPENSFEALRETFEANYDPRLALELLKYTYVPPRAVVVDWIPTYGPLVDLGLLEGGMKVTINYRVVNETADEILIDATTKNFGAEDTDVKMFTKPLIPGLSRMITVTFTVPEPTKFYFGLLEILIVNVRNRIHSTVRCPIFYYVDPLLERPILPNVNARSLQDLLYQRLYTTNTPGDITRRRIHTNFSTKRSGDSGWTLTNKFFTSSNSLGFGGGGGGGGTRGSTRNTNRTRTAGSDQPRDDFISLPLK